MPYQALNDIEREEIAQMHFSDKSLSEIANKRIEAELEDVVNFAKSFLRLQLIRTFWR